MERCRGVRGACQSIERSKRYQKEEWRASSSLLPIPEKKWKKRRQRRSEAKKLRLKCQCYVQCEGCMKSVGGVILGLGVCSINCKTPYYNMAYWVMEGFPSSLPGLTSDHLHILWWSYVCMYVAYRARYKDMQYLLYIYVVQGSWDVTYWWCTSLVIDILAWCLHCRC